MIHVNRGIVSVSLMSTFLLFVLVAAASAQTRMLGVSVGNTFTYSSTASWSSNDPSATPPTDLVNFNQTQWAQVSVKAISGTNVTGQLTAHYKNGTEITSDGWVDVDTGLNENLTAWFISKDLVPGDSMYTSSQFNSVTINETVSRTYASGVRETNHINMTSASTSFLGNLTVANDIYWDKSTGVLVELSLGDSNQTGTYTTTWSEDTQISGSNVWAVPEFPTWTATLIMLVALTSTTMIIAKQSARKKRK